MKKIRDIMSPNVTLIRLETTVRDAAEKMKALDVGALPVTDGEKIKGMLTDRDIVVRCIAAGKDPASTPVREAMTERIKFVFDDDDVAAAADAMKDKQIRRLIVLNRAKRLVGLVSFGDLARHAEDVHLSAGVARRVAEPTNAPLSH
jgi:CBS domain-containing protein